MGARILKIIKRSGEEVEFDITKIIAEVCKANKEVAAADRLTIEFWEQEAFRNIFTDLACHIVSLCRR